MAEVTSTLSSLQAAYTESTTAQTTVEDQDDATRLAEDFDAFLLLLTTQMTNQDPLEPMDSAEFTNQLVMFAEAEQSVKQSGYLESLVEDANTSHSLSAVSYIGLDVITPSDQFHMDIETTDPDTGAAMSMKEEILTYYMPRSADSATLYIYDENNSKVMTAALDGDAGEYNVSWDGVKDDGTLADPGNYRFSIDAYDEEGNLIDGVTTATRGVVTNVRYDGTDTTLTLDGIRTVKIEEVTGVGQSGMI